MRSENQSNLKLHCGEIVDVKSKEDNLQTLDDAEELEGLPFMPEMFTYCGVNYKVLRRVERYLIRKREK